MVKLNNSFKETFISFIPDKKNLDKEIKDIIEKIKTQKSQPFHIVFLSIPFEFSEYIIEKFKNIFKIKSLSKINKETVIEF